MMEVFGWVESTPVSIWVRESLWGFPAMLILHALGMGVLAGGGVLIALRRMRPGNQGEDPGKAASYRGFIVAMWGGFWVSLASGLMLLAAYPAKALTNPVFGLKFALLGCGFLLVRQLLADADQSPELARHASVLKATRAIAVGAIVMIAGAIFAGRFLAYTHTVLLAY